MPKLSRLSAIPAIALVAILLTPPSGQGTAQGQTFPEATASTASTPQYDTATLLLEDLGGGTTVELTSALTTFGNFYILPEGDSYYLWLDNLDYPDYGIEQRLESQDGLVWHDRTDTNLSGFSGSYRRAEGLRTVIKNDEGIYEGWQQYYYESSIGWGHAHRYVTSTNGITWTVVNQPALIGSLRANVIKVEDTYNMWATTSFDSSMSSDPKPLRHRTSSSGGTGWGDWQTGGDLVSVDGQPLIYNWTFVRRLPDGTYQLFYHANEDPEIHLAASGNGVQFTTVVTGLLNAEEVIPPGNTFNHLRELVVVNVGGEDWIYFSFRDQAGTDHLAVSRPIYYTFLPLVLQDHPSTAFPLHIGDAIPARSVIFQGETFYSTTLQIPNTLPAGGHFYLSSQPDTVAEALVDDKVAVVLASDDIFVFNFSTSGLPEPATVEIPRVVMEQMSGQTVTVEYRDVYGSVVNASAMWLIWTP
ncbi:MAG: hypothetical protein JW918_19720 [Anaerolineae bacterium]|nr:hypothetical protein [Anaerolineae bacterium]